MNFWMFNRSSARLSMLAARAVVASLSGDSIAINTYGSHPARGEANLATCAAAYNVRRLFRAVL